MKDIYLSRCQPSLNALFFIRAPWAAMSALGKPEIMKIIHFKSNYCLNSSNPGCLARAMLF